MSCKASDDIVKPALLSLLRPASASHLHHLGKDGKSGTRRDESQAAAQWRRARPEVPNPKVTVIERLTEATVSVSWSDSVSGRFGEQIWRAGFARHESYCVLTGTPIRRGDAIFRPWHTGIYGPPNRRHMMLTVSVWAALPVCEEV